MSMKIEVGNIDVRNISEHQHFIFSNCTIFLSKEDLPEIIKLMKNRHEWFNQCYFIGVDK